MTAKDRFLNELLKRNGKERWVAALILTAPPEVLSSVTVKTNFPFREGSEGVKNDFNLQEFSSR
ncbi:hypothetical protein ABDI30_22630 [Paenibacillus cisolokensis]|uniref:hypothetical protein n=1 Tax=Paenibacillus cisolokensis TaxID=1658519 RepID=UPI003D28F513